MNRFRKASMVVALAIAMTLVLAVPARAASPGRVYLDAADSFAVLAYSKVENTGNSVVTGNLGLTPTAGSGITGFYTPGVVNGTIYTVNASGPTGYVENPALLTSAKDAQTAAYLDAAGRTVDVVDMTGQDLGGKILPPGVYRFSSSAGLTGILTLDGTGYTNPVWIFQIGSTLTTAAGAPNEPAARVVLAGGATPCDVFWQVGSSATIGTYSEFQGNILALASVTMTTGANLLGSAHALNGAVTLDDNDITKGPCAVSPVPYTGTTPDKKGTLWNTAMLAGVFTVSILFAGLILFMVARRKRQTS